MKDVEVDGQHYSAIIDTGCSVSLVNSGVVNHLPCKNVCLNLLTLGGERVTTQGMVEFASLTLENCDLGSFVAYKVRSLPQDVSFIIGLDVLLKQEFTMFMENGKIRLSFGPKIACGSTSAEFDASTTELCVKESDFEATFNENSWTVSWIWKDAPPPKNISRPNYKINEEDEELFDEEMSAWIDENILVPWEEQYGQIRNVIPLMGVRQQKGDKVKVRPVLDFRYLNDYVKSEPASATPLCRERLRQWRQKGPNCAVVDLKRAYLQVKIDPKLWCYQAVRWKGKTYLLTRLGFGLNIAPKVMTKIVETVLFQNELISSRTSSYIDDIYIVEEELSADTVVNHLQKYGLTSKPIERIGEESDVRVLGLRVDRNLRWRRDSELREVPQTPITRRQAHSLLGEWLGHFPVAGWLRVACAFIQRCTAKDGVGWDENISKSTHEKLLEINESLKTWGDPCKGRWIVNKDSKTTVWTDASSIATGVALQMGEDIVEDASWLRKEDDANHINISELDAVIKGINLVVNWDIRSFTLMTDSLTVYNWLQSVLRKTHNVRTHALGELLIRRRLNLLDELIKEEGLHIRVELVKSAENKADKLTRVPKSWLQGEKHDFLQDEKQVSNGVALVMSESQRNEIEQIHSQNHFGVKRTLELAQIRFGQEIVSENVQDIIDKCESCAKICPAVRNRAQKGHLTSSTVWEWLSIDLCHFGRKTYLTVIDNASRFCIWRQIRNQSSKEVCHQLGLIFTDMGAPEFLLSDNAAVFHSREMKILMNEWEIEHIFSCAYRPQGNGIIERNHKTIKIMATRSGNSVEKCAFWYNVTRGDRNHSPHELLFHVKPRIPGVRSIRERNCVELELQEDRSEEMKNIERNPFVLGDRVYLRSSGMCSDPWTGPHIVTKIKSAVSLEIDEDGITRHISHVRKKEKVDSNIEHYSEDTETSNSESENDGFMPSGDNQTIELQTQDWGPIDSAVDAQILRRSERTRQSPAYLNDYV